MSVCLLFLSFFHLLLSLGMININEVADNASEMLEEIVRKKGGNKHDPQFWYTLNPEEFKSFKVLSLLSSPLLLYFCLLLRLIDLFIGNATIREILPRICRRCSAYVP